MRNAIERIEITHVFKRFRTKEVLTGKTETIIEITVRKTDLIKIPPICPKTHCFLPIRITWYMFVCCIKGTSEFINITPK